MRESNFKYMTKLSDKITQEIELKILKPKPKWQFRLKESGQWLSVVVLILVVAFSGAMLWLFASELDIGINGWLSGKPFLAGRTLWFILIALVLAVVAVLFDIRKTKNGYKYKNVIIISLIVVIGLIFAGIFAWSGLPNRFDRSLSGNSLYQNREQYMISVWQNPNEGRITGEIIAINQSNLTIRDFSNKIWQIDSGNAVWRHNLKPEVGLRIKLLGNQISENSFTATDIRPFLPPNGGCGGAETNGGLGGCNMTR